MYCYVYSVYCYVYSVPPGKEVRPVSKCSNICNQSVNCASCVSQGLRQTCIKRVTGTQTDLQ